MMENGRAGEGSVYVYLHTDIYGVASERPKLNNPLDPYKPIKFDENK